MKKNSVLTEATFRRFMKLANMQPVGNSVISEYDFDGADLTEEEEDLEADLEADLDVPVADDVPADDMPLGPEEGEGEGEGDLDVTLDAGQVEALIALGNQLEGGGGEVEELPLDDPAEELPAEELPVEEPSLEDPEDEAAALEEAGVEVVDDDALVAEVTRRVAAKLLSLSKK